MEVSGISKNHLMVNEEIRDKEIRLIDVDGSMLGIFPVREAQKMAYSKNLDLVRIAPHVSPVVCRIMDYGKYMFENSKKEKEAKKKKQIIVIKEVKISPNIEEHDFNFKLKNATKFLKNGDKVKITVKFKGREINYTSLGKVTLEKFAGALEDYGAIEKRPKLEGKNMSMIMSPKSL
jgi:translation initiation factor IF-3